MKYLLINPPLYDVLPFVGMSQPAHLLRIAAFLRSRGDSVSFFDYEPVLVTGPDRVADPAQMVRVPARTGIVKTYGATEKAAVLNRYGKSDEDLEQFLATIEKPDKVFVASLMTFHCRGVHDVVRVCKRVYPGVDVTVGGIYASLCPEHAARSSADHVFVGEIPEANAMKPDMDLLEYPPRYAILKTRWGCPNRCSYCAVHKLEGRKVRSMPPEMVFRHIEELHADYGIRYFYTWDSNTLLDWNRHYGRLLAMLGRSGLDVKIEFPYGFQPDLLTDEMCVQMKDADVSDFFPLPIESADDQMCNDRFHRRTTVTDLKRAVDRLRAVGYENFLFYILAGMPEQPLESVMRSCQLAWELGGRPVILPFTPIPKTEEYENYKHLIEGKDLEDLMPSLLPFCTNEEQLNDLLQLRDYSMKTLAETELLLESQLHVKTWQTLKARRDAAALVGPSSHPRL